MACQPITSDFMPCGEGIVFIVGPFLFFCEIVSKESIFLCLVLLNMNDIERFNAYMGI